MTSCQRPIRGANRKSESYTSVSAVTNARRHHRPLSKRAVVFNRAVDPRELKRSPNRVRLVARVAMWATAVGGAAFVLPHVLM